VALQELVTQLGDVTGYPARPNGRAGR